MHDQKTRPLADIFSVVRSKNAGPFLLTLDIVVRDEPEYERLQSWGELTAQRLGPLYNTAEDEISIEWFPLGRAIKIMIPRLVGSGAFGDTDVYGAQQHAPLLAILNEFAEQL